MSWQILDPVGKTVATAEAGAVDCSRWSGDCSRQLQNWRNPALWSLEEPNLYSAIVTVETGGKARDAERVSFGVRTLRFDADKGFFLNGKSMKIRVPAITRIMQVWALRCRIALQWFRLAVLREMGGNAVRTSHNMPTPEWVEACDRMGMMMMCETRQMSSNPEGLAQLDAMVKRYRNSPSIIIWSIGNEEWQHAERDGGTGRKDRRDDGGDGATNLIRRAWYRRR